MAVSTEQYQRLLARLTRLEETVNDILVANNHYVSLAQVQQLLTIQKTIVEDLAQTVASLEDRVEAIEEEPIT